MSSSGGGVTHSFVWDSARRSQGWDDQRAARPRLAPALSTVDPAAPSGRSSATAPQLHLRPRRAADRADRQFRPRAVPRRGRPGQRAAAHRRRRRHQGHGELRRLREPDRPERGVLAVQVTTACTSTPSRGCTPCPAVSTTRRPGRTRRDDAGDCRRSSRSDYAGAPLGQVDSDLAQWPGPRLGECLCSKSGRGTVDSLRHRFADLPMRRRRIDESCQREGRLCATSSPYAAGGGDPVNATVTRAVLKSVFRPEGLAPEPKNPQLTPRCARRAS